MTKYIPAKSTAYTTMIPTGELLLPFAASAARRIEFTKINPSPERAIESEELAPKIQNRGSKARKGSVRDGLTHFCHEVDGPGHIVHGDQTSSAGLTHLS